MKNGSDVSNLPGGEKGFTLVEVMVALTLVAIVFVPLISLRNLNVRQTAFARQALRAAFLAHEKLSNLQLSPGIASGEEAGDFGRLFGLVVARNSHRGTPA